MSMTMAPSMLIGLLPKHRASFDPVFKSPNSALADVSATFMGRDSSSTPAHTELVPIEQLSPSRDG